MRSIKFEFKKTSGKSFLKDVKNRFETDKRLKMTSLIAIGSLAFIAALIIISPRTYLFNPIDKDNPVSSPIVSDVQNSTEPASIEVKILIGGDVMMARSVGSAILKGINPYEFVRPTFDKYDIVALNLETNVSTPGIGYATSGKLYTFNSPVKSLDVLKDNGVKIVSLANNHVADYGKNALVDQINQLDSRGIAHVGGGKNIDEAFEPKYILVKDYRVAFVAFNDIENWYTNATNNSAGNANFDDARMAAAIKKAKENADVVIVWPHFGIEYSLSNSGRQQQYARFFIDNGADIVVGAHPHVLQNTEEYNGKMIYYSLGNFVFDGMTGIANATDGAMAEIIIKDGQIESSRLIKIKIGYDGFPKLAE